MSKIKRLQELLAAATKGPFKLCTPCTRPGKNTCGIVWAADNESNLLPFDDSCTDMKRSDERVLADKQLIVEGLNALPELLAFVDTVRLRHNHCMRNGNHPREHCVGCAINDALKALTKKIVEVEEVVDEQSG